MMHFYKYNYELSGFLKAVNFLAGLLNTVLVFTNKVERNFHFPASGRNCSNTGK
jgi:hypothetical protein